jgi:hypothetical protein
MEKKIDSTPLNYLVVTGVNDKYFDILIQYLQIYEKNQYDFTKLIIYDLGLSKKNLDMLINISKKVNFTIKNFDYDNYPDHLNLNKFYGKNCTYAWKPIIIYNECINNKDKYVIWSDTRTLFRPNSIKNICSVIDKEGAWIVVSNMRRTPSVINYMYNPVLEYFKISREEVNQFDMKWAGTCAFKYNNAISKFIVDEWYKYSLIKEAICPNGSDRSNHRQDQSLLSIILYKNDLHNHFSNNWCDLSGWYIGPDTHIGE